LILIYMERYTLHRGSLRSESASSHELIIEGRSRHIVQWYRADCYFDPRGSTIAKPLPFLCQGIKQSNGPIRSANKTAAVSKEFCTVPRKIPKALLTGIIRWSIR
jgi:hypothetical protein